MEDLSSLKVADLRKELKLRSLPITGTKPELVQRLQEALNSDDSAMDDALLDEDSVLGEDDDDVSSSDNENNTSHEVDSTSALLSPTKTTAVVQPAIAAKIPASPKATTTVDKKRNGATKEAGEGETLVKKAKITINREPVQPPAVVGKVAAPTSPKQAVAATKSVNTIVTPPGESSAVKLNPSALTVADRAKLREQKFGAITPDSPTKAAPATNVTGKLKQRADRFGASLSTGPTAGTGKVALTNEDEARLAKRRERFGALLNEGKPTATSETKQKRAERFGALAVTKGEGDEKKKSRAERFAGST